MKTLTFSRSFSLRKHCRFWALGIVWESREMVNRTLGGGDGREVFGHAGHARRLRPWQLGRAARLPASAAAHDRGARMTTTRGLDDDA